MQNDYHSLPTNQHCLAADLNVLQNTVHALLQAGWV